MKSIWFPFLGSRRIVDELAEQGVIVNRKHVQRLMRVMGLAALYPKRKTSAAAPGHKTYPYLLRGVTIDRPGQVWCTGVTYLPMASGFLYLVAVMEWYSRRVLAWRVSNTIDTAFCVEALTEALETYGPPEIFNTDQGAMFTARAFTSVLESAGVTISMDGRGRWMDNVMIERLWRSVKYEEVYLHAYETGAQARAGLAAYFEFYNTRRRHQGLGGLTPDEAYSKKSSYREPHNNPATHHLPTAADRSNDRVHLSHARSLGTCVPRRREREAIWGTGGCTTDGCDSGSAANDTRSRTSPSPTSWPAGAGR